MMKTLLTTATFAVVLMTVPAMAQETSGAGTGEVKEVLIKVQTADGPRWYKLGADITNVDVREGKVVRFDYADDTIHAIEVEPSESGASTD